MGLKIILYATVILLITKAHSQSTNCNKIPFYPADYIRNPSLEKVGAFCWDQLGSIESPPFTGKMETVIPFWRIPIWQYGAAFYFGECNNFSVGPNLNFSHFPKVPQPVPQGSGVIGLISTRSPVGSPSEERILPKFYISTNLIRELTRDSLYRLDFALGFGQTETLGKDSHVSFTPVRFTIFGLRDSTKIPFQRPQSPGILGCLTVHFPDWIPLGSVVVDGNQGEWKRAVIDFLAPSNIQSIAIGSACDNSDLPITSREFVDIKDFYFIADIRFFQASAPKPRLSKIGGNSCEGETTTLRLQSNDFYNGSSFQWYRNNSPLPETNVAITTSSSTYGPGWYKMRVQNDSVCMMSDSVYLEWAPRIIDPYLGKPDTTLCMGETIELKISAGTNATYLWSTGNTDSAITVNQTGTYTVRVSNACNALNVLKTVLYKDCPPAVFVPTAFTPNGDGLNDIFRVTSSGTIKSFSLSVYDRFGQRIFFSDDPSRGWDGKINGKIQNTALFIWILRYTDGSDKTVSQKGTVTLIR